MHDSQMGLFVLRHTEDYELHLPTLTLRAHPIVRHVLFVPGIYSMVTRYDMSLTHSTTTQPKQPQGIMHMQSELIGGDSLHTALRFLSSRPQASPRSNVDEHQLGPSAWLHKGSPPKKERLFEMHIVRSALRICTGPIRADVPNTM